MTTQHLSKTVTALADEIENNGGQVQRRADFVKGR